VDKQITLVNGHSAVYVRHTVSRMSGPMCFGHHAMLTFPNTRGSGVISTSPFVYGQVFPEPVENPENRGYSTLAPGAEFRSLRRVRTITGSLTDVSTYPARRGFEDLVLLAGDPRLSMAWTAVVFARHGYVWFALKDPQVLRSTILWMSNGGRHYPPWNGRHVNVMGLEEVTANFHYGLAESVRSNPLSKRGIPTALSLSASQMLTVNYIMAVAAIPPGFDRVKSIRALPGGVRLIAASGKHIPVALEVAFLRGAED